MLWRDVAALITITETDDDGAGGVIETETRREVFVNKKSIRQSEFYQAMAYGLRPDLMIELRAEDYADEALLEQDGKTYHVIRSFSKNGEVLELVCSTRSTMGGGA